MKSIIRIIAILGIALFAITGCSKGSSNPVQPDNTGAAGQPALRMPSGRNLLGVYEIHLRSNVPGAEVRINRTIQSHVNATAEDYVGVEVALMEYNPYFAFRNWAIWRLTIILTNQTNNFLYDVRGIILLNNTALGLHNADGLTTAWGNGVDPNPFIYYGDISGYYTDQKEFQVKFSPPKTTLNCTDCEWETDFESELAGGGLWNPELYIKETDPQDVWVNFAVDASIDEPCQEPYSIEVTQSTTGSLYYPTLTLTVTPYLHDPVNNEVTCVKIILDDVPGFPPPYNEVHSSGQYGDDWIIILTIGEDLKHEAIYHGRIAATSLYPDPPDLQTDPNVLYKDIRIIVGDLDSMIDERLFNTEVDDVIDDILTDWDSRYGDIYNSSNDFFIEDHFTYGSGFPHIFLIKFRVGDGPDEYGALRLPPLKGGTENDEFPLMVFCHWGKFVWLTSEDKPPYGFVLYDDFENYDGYKDKFAILIPAYRGNALCYIGNPTQKQYGSYDDEINSPADYDVDDVLAFLNLVIYHEEDIESEVSYGGDSKTLLNEDKVGIMGGSRGGSPTYLAKIRDSLYEKNQIDRAIVTIGSVTDFLLEDIKTACRDYIAYDGYFPGCISYYYLEDYNVFKHVLQPYLDGKFDGNDYDEYLKNARKKLVSSSPKYFAEFLDYVQVHHGELDNLCRLAQTDELVGIIGGNSEIHHYPSCYHGILPDDGDDSSPPVPYGYYITAWYDKIINGN